MATTHILAVGRVSNGAVEMQMALPPLQTLIDAGEAAQADEDALIDSLFAAADEDDAPLLPIDLIDYDAELDDLIEGRLDDEYHSRGMW